MRAVVKQGKSETPLKNMSLKMQVEEFIATKKKVDKLNLKLKELKQDMEEGLWELLGEQKSVNVFVGTNGIKFSVSEKITLADIPALEQELGDKFNNFVNISFSPKSGFKNLLDDKNILKLVKIQEPTATISLA